MQHGFTGCRHELGPLDQLRFSLCSRHLVAIQPVIVVAPLQRTPVVVVTDPVVAAVAHQIGPEIVVARIEYAIAEHVETGHTDAAVVIWKVGIGTRSTTAGRMTQTEVVA